MALSLKYYSALIAAILLIAVLVITSLFIGVVNISVVDLISGNLNADALEVFVISRIPRSIALLLAGSSMAIAGLIMQLLVRNRFVEPATAGTLESATLGLLVVTLLAPSWSVFSKMLVAAGFALVGTMLFLRIAKKAMLQDILLVPLIGIMLGGVIGAITTFFAYKFDLLQSLLAWTIGDFSAVLQGRYELLWLGFFFALIAYFIADRLTVISMGQDFTTNLGISYKQVMRFGLLVVSLVAATVVVTVGVIPFLGLVVPNIVSLIMGDNMRRSIVWVAILGAVFILVCDILGRIIRAPYEIPIGTVMGVVGSVLFLYLLLRKKNA